MYSKCKVCGSMGAHGPGEICHVCRTLAVPEEVMAPGGDAAYERYIARLQGLVDNRREALLTRRQQDQLMVYRSNARYLKQRLAGLPLTPGAVPAGDQQAWDRWKATYDRLVHALQAEGEPKSVFTRDVDQGELVGHSRSGGTASVVDRTQLGIGRIRNAADLNRGGGAGSYVRFLCTNQRVDDQNPRVPAPLAVGKIGYSGVTIIYDASSVVAENSAPAHLLHNNQDSAGRVFGTWAANDAELARNGGLSERLLGRANPTYHKPGRPRELEDSYILNHAAASLELLLDQVQRGQTATQAYNEQILMTGASVGSIKAILIHRPAVTPGRPPQMQAIAPDQVTKAEARALAQENATNRRLDEVVRERRELEREVLDLRHLAPQPGLRDQQRAVDARISELVTEEARLRTQLARPNDVATVKSVPRLAPLTDRVVRSTRPWEDDQLPAVLSHFAGKTGLGGIPIRFLFLHVNPEKVQRVELPEKAHAIYTAGTTRWELAGAPAT